jgi:hypothetical protein
MAPGIKALLNMTRDIADGYRKYRKKGGLAIPGLEKHLAVKKCECVDPEPAPAPEEISAEPVKAKVSVPSATAKKRNRRPASNQSNAPAVKAVTGEAAQVDA